MRFWLPERRHVASAMRNQRRSMIDLTVIFFALALFFLATRDLDLFEKLVAFTESYEQHQFDEVVVVALLSVFGLIVFGIRRLVDLSREIATRKDAEDRAQRLALADPLTGLPNRRQLGESLAALLGKHGGNTAMTALMLIDLDRFKQVNDVFGHAIGDEVLISFAQRAGTIIQSKGMLCRLGGDEFALVLPSVTDIDEPARVARRLIGIFEKPFDVGETPVTLGASIGIALASPEETIPGELMRRSDIALYRAKSDGRGTFRFFEEHMDTQVKLRARVERDLRQAIDDGTVRPHYQPIVDLKTGGIIGFEALARWSNPEYNELEPQQFIQIAEDCGLIIQLGSHLLRLAARDAVQWPSDIKLCFNISPVQLADPMLVLRVLHILGETGLHPTRLELEISEQALVSDIAAAQAALDGFRTAGVRIALDDFGTGNSSLQHLRACHFDRIKIDRTFVMSMADSDEDRLLVNAILGLSKALGLPVTAEGIENQALIGQLVDGGCSEGQGYYFGKALPSDAALRLLETGTVPQSLNATLPR